MKPLIYCACLSALLLSPTAQAKLYKWIDGNGVTHYGEVVPPEYANQDRKELNKKGEVVKSIDILTPEEEQAKQAKVAEKEENIRAANERKRRDQMLLNTFSTVKEIELARDRNMLQVDAKIKSNNSQLLLLTNKLADLKGEAAGYEKRNRKVPESLVDELQDTQNRVVKTQANLDRSVAEKSAIQLRFESDINRFVELNGKR